CSTVEDKIRVENQTLKHLIKKCLDTIDKCLCIDKSIIAEKQDINVLINGYNEWLFDNQDLDELDTKKEDYEDMFDHCFDAVMDLQSDGDDEEYNPLNDSKPKRLSISRGIRPQNSSILASNWVKKKYRKHKTVTAGVITVCDWPECGKQFRNSYNFQQHRNKHLGVNKYQCDWPGCEETFAKKVNYDMHTSLHTNEKKFKCHFLGCHYETCRNNLCKWVGSDGNACNWAFRQSTHLKAHMLKHTGERPYRCEWPNGQCDRSFASRQAMRFHSQKSHNFIIPQK
ncbi:unnamed protein product, partial [Oppiella nova]